MKHFFLLTQGGGVTRGNMLLSEVLIAASLLCGTYGAAIRYAAPQVPHLPAPYTAPVAKAVYARDATPVVAYRGHAGPVVYAPKEEESSPVYLEYNLNPQYNYAYEVQDYHTGDSKGQQETRSGDVVKGSYKVVDPDGSKRTVEYTADDQSGFNAVVHREPAPTHTNVDAAPVSYITYSKAALPAAPVYLKVAAPNTERSHPYSKEAPVTYAAPIYAKAAPAGYSTPIYAKAAPTGYAAPIYANAAPVEYAAPVYAKAAPAAYVAPIYAKAASGAYPFPVYAKVTPVQYASPIYANIAAPSSHDGHIYVNSGTPYVYSPKEPVAVTRVVSNAVQQPYVAPAVRYGAPERKGFPKHGPITKYTGPLVVPAASTEARYLPYNIQATPVILSAKYEARQAPEGAYPSSTAHYS